MRGIRRNENESERDISAVHYENRRFAACRSRIYYVMYTSVN